MNPKESIVNGETFLGIELGSTRIKAALIDGGYKVIASGEHAWENRFENGYWTYSLEDIQGGLSGCYSDLKRNVRKKYGVILKNIGCIGISGMMHGYMAFDEGNRLLTPFRTWRCTTTAKAAAELTELLSFNIPQRWSIAHLCQAVLDKEPHTEKIAWITTLSGYIHFLLTGEHIVGIGEASGMLPVSKSGFDAVTMEKLNGYLKEKGFTKSLQDILPQIKAVGEICGALTEEGAKLLDTDGDLQSKIPFCPPEGDAQTGMVATNSVKEKTGNISAGTSIFAMLVQDRQLSNVYPEIDIVATPEGLPTFMVHCNNCCSELDAWINVFEEFSRLLGIDADKSELYRILYQNALTAPADCNGVTAFNFVSGEPVVKIKKGFPAYCRMGDGKLTLAGFMRAQLYSSFASLAVGMNILLQKEKIGAERFTAHGGLLKVKGTAQQLLADALGVPVSVNEAAAEGGAWGIALLAAYCFKGNGKSLSEWLDSSVFSDMSCSVLMPDNEGTKGFNEYLKRYCGLLNLIRIPDQNMENFAVNRELV